MSSWQKDVAITPAGQETGVLGRFKGVPLLSESQEMLLNGERQVPKGEERVTSGGTLGPRTTFVATFVAMASPARTFASLP
jgi:hypothetical protein